jgi:hypothetical protein
MTFLSVCRSPITFILALNSLALYPINSISIPIQIAAHVLAYSNVCLNPFIYAAAHPGFRSSFKALLCCGRIRSPAHGDFERTDAGESGTTTGSGYLRSRSFRQSKASRGREREGSGPVITTTTTTNNNNNNVVEAEHIPLTLTESNHTDNGINNYAENENFLPKKQATARQQSNDSIF